MVVVGGGGMGVYFIFVYLFLASVGSMINWRFIVFLIWVLLF